MAFPYSVLRPLLFRANAESAHDAVLAAAKLGGRVPWLTRSMFRGKLPESVLAYTRTEVFGLNFETPVGVAAGVDKNAVLIRTWPSLGAGFCEVGSISARPAPGNPKPRAFRLPDDRALVNRMGLNNDGAARIAERMGRTQRPARFPVGVNLVKTHDPTILGEAGIQDFVDSARVMLPLADFCVLNVSCPNTQEGKTFESPESLAPLLDAVMAERARQGSNVPMLVKLSPPSATTFDHGPIDELVELCLDRGIVGFVATNTAGDRAGLKTDANTLESIGAGGLSGPPLADRATALLRHLFRTVDGRARLIGVGGIDSVDAAYRRIRSGADLVEMYTGLVYEGPGLFARIARGLAARLEADGFRSVRDAVGCDVT